MDAILIVDAQYDFFPGGSLGVVDGDQIVEPITRLLNKKRVENNEQYNVYTTQDWHPEKTKHFQEGGGIWPPHCIANTRGAEIHEEIARALLPFSIAPGRWLKQYTKGTDPESDGGYSAFEARSSAQPGRPLAEGLLTDKIKSLIVCGLATDYCIKASVLDAFKHGLRVELFLDGIRAVNLKEGDGDAAIKEMVEAGAKTVSSKEFGV